MFAGLRGGHLDYLARVTLDYDMTVLAQGGALLGIGRRRTSIYGRKVLRLFRLRHGLRTARREIGGEIETLPQPKPPQSLVLLSAPRKKELARTPRVV